MFTPSSWQICDFQDWQAWSGFGFLHIAPSSLHFLHKRGHQMKVDTSIYPWWPSVWYECCLTMSWVAISNGKKVARMLASPLWAPSSLQSTFYCQPNLSTHDKKRFCALQCKYFLTWWHLVLGWGMVGHDLIFEIRKTGKSLDCEGLFGNPKVHQDSK